MIVSGLHNQIDHKVEKLKYMKLDLRQQKVKDKSQLPALNKQCEKKVVSNSPGLVDFAIRLVNYVRDLPGRKVKLSGEFKLQENRNQSCCSIIFWGVVEMIWGLIMLAATCPNGKL